MSITSGTDSFVGLVPFVMLAVCVGISDCNTRSLGNSTGGYRDHPSTEKYKSLKGNGTYIHNPPSGRTSKKAKQ